MGPAMLPGVDGGTLLQEGEVAMEVDAAENGGFMIDDSPSNEVITLVGIFSLADMLHFRLCPASDYESVCVMGANWSVCNFRHLLACLSTCGFLKAKAPNSSSAGVVASRPP